MSVNLARYAADIMALGTRACTPNANSGGVRLISDLAADTFSRAVTKFEEMFLSTDSSLFSWAKQRPELSMKQIDPESLVLVHRTAYYPKGGKILSTADATRNIDGVAEYRPTVHFALNKSVTEHAVGNSWNTMEYSIILPFKETVSSMPSSKIIGGIQDDFFLMNSVALPKGSVILRRSSEIPNGQYKVTDVFDGVKLIETSADDMVAATDLVIKKMGYTPYNKALQDYLGASADEMRLITSMPESELLATYAQLAGNLKVARTQFRHGLKTVEEMKEIYSPEDYRIVKKSIIDRLKHCDIAEKYYQKLQEFPNVWQEFCGKQNYYNGLHQGTFWAESEKIFGGLSLLVKGSRKSWVWNGVDYKSKLLEKLQACRTKIPKDKDMDYDVDKVISIIQNSSTPEAAEKEIIKQLRIKGMKPVDRSAEFEQMGFSANDVKELKEMRDEHPESWFLDFLLDLL